MKKSGNYIPVQTTPQTVASGQTPISLDWDYNNLAYVTEFPAASWGFTVPADGVYGGYYAQAINATAPHPNAARLWEEFLYSDQGQIIWLKGGAHPARFADLVAPEGDPAVGARCAAVGRDLQQGEVREPRPADGCEDADRVAVADEGRRRSPIATDAAPQALRPDVESGRRRLPLGWLATLPVLRVHRSRSCSCPPASVLIGAFQDNAGSRDVLEHPPALPSPVHRRVLERASRSASSRPASAPSSVC